MLYNLESYKVLPVVILLNVVAFIMFCISLSSQED